MIFAHAINRFIAEFAEFALNIDPINKKSTINLWQKYS
jgi:hypothetical protein